MKADKIVAAAVAERIYNMIARPMYTPEKIEALKADEIFVFGSNLKGSHDGGAARAAHLHFGAIMGLGVGLQGQSYAIPTMQGGVDTIKPYVDQFIQFAENHKDLFFYVTRIGCGIAGFRDEEMAPLFAGAAALDNVCLPKSFADVLHANLPQVSQSNFESCPLTPSWDAQKWLYEFAQGVARRATRPVRATVFQSTLQICRNNRYVSSHGIEVKGFLHTADACANNVFVEREISLKRVGHRYATKVSVINDDCLKVAKDLVSQYGSDEVCVLNMASRQNPGGGVFGGAGAQEEYLFRCTDYYRFLYQYASTFDPQALYGIPRHHSHHYPLNQDFGGVFSRGVTVFRASEAEGYALVDNPWSVNMVAVAGINLMGQHVGSRLTEPLVAGNLNKIRTILRLSYNNGQTRLVLGALGCGAFGNPPVHIAELFHQVQEEPEFKGIFKEVVFAIIKDHNDTNNTNYKAFHDEFCGM